MSASDPTLAVGDAEAHLTLALACASPEQAAAVATILQRGAGLLGLPEGATLSGPAGLVPERRGAWTALADAVRLDAERDPITPGRFRVVRAGAWESVLASLLIERDWATIARAAAELSDEIPHTGESTAPLTEEHVATLVDYVRVGNRAGYDALCAALGVVNGPALWAGTRRRLGLD